MIKILVLIFSVASFAANEPMFIKNQQGGAKEKIRDFQAPNNLATKLGTEQFLVETGNTNILSNPSFEHSTFSTSWTNSAGTFTQEASVVIAGKASAKLVLSAQTMSLTQSSTLYAAQFADGVQGIVTVRIKSNVALKVCSIQAGTVSTSNCVDVPNDNKWGLYKIPFILGATSNGISIASNGTLVTGTVYVDDAFVGAVDLSATQSFDTTCDTRACTTQLTARLSSNTVSTIDNSGWISCSASGDYASCNFAVGTFTVAPSCQVSTLLNSNNTLAPKVLTISSSAITVMASNAANASFNVGNYFISCNKQGADYTSAITAMKNYEKMTVSSFSSTNADTDWASCGHTAASFTGFGTVTAIETQCKRQGSDLLMKGKFTSGTVTAVESRVSLPLWNGTQLVSAGTSKIPSFQILGLSVRSNVGAANNIFAAIQPSSSYFVFTSLASPAGTTSILGSSFGSSETQTMGVLRIPINGWTQSNIIIGQFNGLQSCTDTLACTDTFSASIDSSGNVSQENVNWLNGNCGTATSGVNTDYTCGYVTSLVTQPMNCVTVDSSSNTSPNATRVFASSSTQFQASNLIGRGIRVICQKQGADYIGKTAMAVASDQNVRTPGVTNVGVHAFQISSACGLTKSSLSGATTTGTATATSNCTINFPANTWSDIYYCGGNSTWSGTQDNYLVTGSLSTSSYVFYVRYNGTTGSNAAAWIQCMGVLK